MKFNSSGSSYERKRANLVYCKRDLFAPWVDHDEATTEYGVSLVTAPLASSYDAVILAMAHHQFKTLGAAGIRDFVKPNGVVYDLKYVLPKDAADLRL